MQDAPTFDPEEYRTFRFTDRTLDESGVVQLHYELGDLRFVERFELPAPPHPDAVRRGSVQRLLALLHLVAGVSYYKLAAPPEVEVEGPIPTPAVAELLDALYSEGLGEYAVVNDLPQLPSPRFPRGRRTRRHASGKPRRVLVPIGGGKDSVVALEIIRQSGVEAALFSIGNAPPIERTADVANLRRLQVTRRIDPQVAELNARGARNGHVPVTAIVSCAALLTAALHDFDTVALANERSASAGNRSWHGVEVNHQFSKSWHAEQLLANAVAELTGDTEILSVLRPASELSIARAFARMPEYHGSFTSCNRVFRLDPELRTQTWCTDCDKCRFVFLILAPFLPPPALERIFGRDMLADPAQADGFAELAGVGGHKPFECVGEVEESVAAMRLVAADPRWSDHVVVQQLAERVLPLIGEAQSDPHVVLQLSDEHRIPAELMEHVRAVLGA